MKKEDEAGAEEMKDEIFGDDDLSDLSGIDLGDHDEEQIEQDFNLLQHTVEVAHYTKDERVPESSPEITKPKLTKE